MFEILRHLFTPHHTNNHRPRILHSAGIAVLLAVVLGSHAAISLVETAGAETGIVLGYASDIRVDDVIAQTNQQRQAVGLEPLITNPELTQAAQAKANHMFEHDYWDHYSPDGVTPWSFIRNAGYSYTVAGENLARDFDSTAPMVDAWMASPTHKENIVHPRYIETGVAVVNGNLKGVETTLVVQLFGSPLSPVLAEKQAETGVPESAAQNQAGETELAAETEPTPISESEPATIQEPSFETVAGTSGTNQPGQAVTASDVGDSSRVIYLSPLTLRKSIVIAVIGLVVGVLVVDELIIHRRQTMRFVGRNWAHLSFLLVLGAIIWGAIQPGVIQ